MIIEFLLKYWQYIVYCLAYLILLIISLIRKKVNVKVDDIFSTVLMVLPNYIKEAENKFTAGPEKFSYVFNRCVDLLLLLTGDSKEDIIAKYTHKIHISIENILSTPEKKER